MRQMDLEKTCAAPTLLETASRLGLRGTLATSGVKALQLGQWRKRLPTIAEADGEDSEEVWNRHADAVPTRLDCLPEWLVDPSCLAHHSDAATTVIQRLKENSKTDRSRVLAWLLKALPLLAASEVGSKVVQAALEVASGSERTSITKEFRGSVLDLSESRYGHQVLVSLIQSMPISAIGFFACEMAGKAAEVARHRFGSCVLEAMTMHCSEAQMAGLAAELLQEAVHLSRDPYGSSVIKHLLEYTNPKCRADIIERLVPEVALLSMHRTASRVIEKAFNCCSDSEQRLLTTALLQARTPVSVVDVARSRCGSWILQEMADTKTCVEEFRERLSPALPRLAQSKFGRRVIASFRLASAGTEAMSCGHFPNVAAAGA